MANNNIRRDDVVVVLSGDSKGTKGKVIACSPKEGKVIVEGANMIHKHVKPRRQGETGGIVDAEGAIYSGRNTSLKQFRFDLVPVKKRFRHEEVPDPPHNQKPEHAAMLRFLNIIWNYEILLFRHMH